jgi:hypothetical protein
MSNLAWCVGGLLAQSRQLRKYPKATAAENLLFPASLQIAGGSPPRAVRRRECREPLLVTRRIRIGCIWRLVAPTIREVGLCRRERLVQQPLWKRSAMGSVAWLSSTVARSVCSAAMVPT